MRTCYLLLGLFLILILASCGDDEANSCTADTWIGTWNQISFDCDTEGVSFDEQITITAGSESGTVIVTGSQQAFDGCTIDGGFAILEISDGEMEVNGFGCKAFYRK